VTKISMLKRCNPFVNVWPLNNTYHTEQEIAYLYGGKTVQITLLEPYKAIEISSFIYHESYEIGTMTEF